MPAIVTGCHYRGAMSRALYRGWLDPNDNATRLCHGHSRRAQSRSAPDLFWRFWLEDSSFVKEAQSGVKSRFSLNLARLQCNGSMGIEVSVGVGPSGAMKRWALACMRLIESLETENLSRVAKMNLYGTFIMAPGQCYGEPTCYMRVLELPWYDYRWGSEKVLSE
ncbi:hypothetical protein L6452_05336 [Arctium lappa]|uniref:Uncharacterized protein n=1 Tax=Arctium lappa TaxID=4217 RepID=A0ACB9EFJ2_ARCLA|nr:hypothetical protein L6452_05336 [Arctium lappa]